MNLNNVIFWKMKNKFGIEFLNPVSLMLTGRAGANSLNFAILIAIPAILTALSHLLLNILAHQGDSQ